MPEDFDPRQAALQYAASVEAYAERTRGTDDQIVALAGGEALHAVVCGLLYVGDQVRALSDVTDEPDRVTFGDLLERLTDIAAAAVPEREEPVASKSVKVVGVGRHTVLLECDGDQSQLRAGDTLVVDGLEVRTVS